MINPAELNLNEEVVIRVTRVSKVTSRGKNFRFGALVVVGDGAGHVGVGQGKAGEVMSAINKAKEDAEAAAKELSETKKEKDEDKARELAAAEAQKQAALAVAAEEATAALAEAEAEKQAELAAAQNHLVVVGELDSIYVDEKLEKEYLNTIPKKNDRIVH